VQSDESVCHSPAPSRTASAQVCRPEPVSEALRRLRRRPLCESGGRSSLNCELFSGSVAQLSGFALGLWPASTRSTWLWWGHKRKPQLVATGENAFQTLEIPFKGIGILLKGICFPFKTISSLAQPVVVCVFSRPSAFQTLGGQHG